MPLVWLVQHNLERLLYIDKYSGSHCAGRDRYSTVRSFLCDIYDCCSVVPSGTEFPCSAHKGDPFLWVPKLLGRLRLYERIYGFGLPWPGYHVETISIGLK